MVDAEVPLLLLVLWLLLSVLLLLLLLDWVKSDSVVGMRVGLVGFRRLLLQPFSPLLQRLLCQLLLSLLLVCCLLASSSVLEVAGLLLHHYHRHFLPLQYLPLRVGWLLLLR